MDSRGFIFSSGYPLEGVHGSTSNEEIKIKYDNWATKYDQDQLAFQYNAPEESMKVFVKIAEKYGVKKQSKIVDIGAGTGMVGDLLKKAGYENIDGIDISPEMLNLARARGCYSKLICGGIGNNTLDMASGEFDVVICIGCLTVGHIQPSGLDEIVDLARPGGFVLFTIREDADSNAAYGFKEKIDELLAENKIKIDFKEKIDYHVNADQKDPGRYSFLYGCIKQK